MAIIRGTTPTIKFTFSQVQATNITVAYLVIKQVGRPIIERDISTATRESDKLSWTLEQAETLKLSKGTKADVYCDWKLQDGTRGRSNVVSEAVEDSGKVEVI